MNLNDLLISKGIDPCNVLVFRHRPREAQLRKVLPWLALEKPDVFNAYQQTQEDGDLERRMDSLVRTGYVASFLGQEPGKALFVGMYSIAGSRPITYEEFWQIPAYIEMKDFGLIGWGARKEERQTVRWFDLVLQDFYAEWIGKLKIEWPGGERSWWRRAHQNTMPVVAVLEESALDEAMPEWNLIDLGWEQLRLLPPRWRNALSQWRGIYYIFDTSEGKGYVGSAYGEQNLLGRWQNYAETEHGGNRLLRQRNPRDFRFTILERVSPDMDPSSVIRLESSWKERLHTRQPYGLNDN